MPDRPRFRECVSLYRGRPQGALPSMVTGLVPSSCASCMHASTIHPFSMHAARAHTCMLTPPVHQHLQHPPASHAGATCYHTVFTSPRTQVHEGLRSPIKAQYIFSCSMQHCSGRTSCSMSTSQEAHRCTHTFKPLVHCREPPRQSTPALSSLRKRGPSWALKFDPVIPSSSPSSKPPCRHSCATWGLSC